MTLKLTDEQLAALDSSPPGEPVQFEDEKSNRTFWLVAADDLPHLWSEYVRAEVNRGLNCLDRGDVVEWNSDSMKDRVRAAAQKSAKAQ